MPYTRGIPVALYAHPFELALGGVLVLNGIRGLTGGLSPSLNTLPTVLLTVYLIISTIGGAGVLAGLLAFRSPVDAPPRLTGPRIERASLYLVAASYAVLAVVILGVNHDRGLGTALICAVVAAACLLRATAIRKAAKIILHRLGERREETM